MKFRKTRGALLLQETKIDPLVGHRRLCCEKKQTDATIKTGYDLNIYVLLNKIIPLTHGIIASLSFLIFVNCLL